MLLVSQMLVVAQTEDKTVLKRKGKEPELVDSASFKRSSNEYRISRGRVSLLLPVTAVEYCRPPKPAGFDRLEDVESLAAVVRKYYRCWWDVEAFKKLMPLYVAKGKNQDAIRLYMEQLGDSRSDKFRRMLREEFPSG